jgi:hypothetical protein
MQHLTKKRGTKKRECRRGEIGIQVAQFACFTSATAQILTHWGYTAAAVAGSAADTRGRCIVVKLVKAEVS